MNEDKIARIIETIRQAETNGALVKNIQLSGFSGEKLLRLLQRLSATHLTENECYLEIGVFQGLTLLSVASVIEPKIAYGIDNFSCHDKNGENLLIVQQRMKNLNIDNAVLINKDYEDAIENLTSHIGNQKIGIFFVDGPHDYRSQYVCLGLIKPFLSENAVIIVDDSNYQHVRQANRDFLMMNPEFKLMFQAYTACHPMNMSKQEYAKAKQGWWNGVNVIVKDPKNILDPMYPPTQRSRMFFENDHIVHASSAAACAPETIRLASSIISFNPLRAGIEFSRFCIKAFKSQRTHKFKYPTMNTFSDNLPESNYNDTHKSVS